MKRSFAPALASVLALAACGQGDIDVAGTWNDDFGSPPMTITNELWGSAKVIKFDNETNFAITQNAADAQFSPNKFNKELWIDAKDGAFYWCTVDFSLDTAEAAEATTKTADATKPEADKSCGAGKWSKMTAKK